MTKARDLSKGVFDTDTLVVDAANNRVGVGTNAPAVALDVVTDVTDNLVAQFENTHSTGSYGIVVKAGDDSGNYAADFRNKSGTSLMRVRGDGASLARAEGGSGLNIDLRQGSAKFWVNYYHVSGTPTAQDSFNVSSLIDRATGRVDIVINNNMNNANYAGGGLAGHDSGTGSSGKTAQLERQSGNPTRTTAVAVQTVYDPTPSVSDVTNDSRAQFVFHGDLA